MCVCVFKMSIQFLSEFDVKAERVHEFQKFKWHEPERKTSKNKTSQYKKCNPQIAITKETKATHLKFYGISICHWGIDGMARGRECKKNSFWSLYRPTLLWVFEYVNILVFSLFLPFCFCFFFQPNAEKAHICINGSIVWIFPLFVHG